MYFDAKVPPQQERQSSFTYTGNDDGAGYRSFQYSDSSLILKPETVYDRSSEASKDEDTSLDTALRDPEALRSYVEDTGPLILSASMTYDFPLGPMEYSKQY